MGTYHGPKELRAAGGLFYFEALCTKGSNQSWLLIDSGVVVTASNDLITFTLRSSSHTGLILDVEEMRIMYVALTVVFTLTGCGPSKVDDFGPPRI